MRFRQATSNNELRLHYQPKVDRRGVLVGFGSRWFDGSIPELGDDPAGEVYTVGRILRGLILPVGRG